MKESERAADYENIYRAAIRQFRLERPAEAWSGYIDEDNLAAARRFAESNEWTESLNLLLTAGIPSGGSVLEIGAGNGIASFAFAEAGFQVCSLDPCRGEDYGTRAMRRLALGGNRSFCIVCGTGERLPFRSSTFDCVYLRQCLHHAADLEILVAEAARVLKAGGLLLTAREHVVSGERQLSEFLRQHPMQAMCGDENAYTVARYLGVVRVAGLTIVKILRPYDSSINLYPDSQHAVMERARAGLARILGATLARYLVGRKSVQTLLRTALNCLRKKPGRLYTFLSRKQPTV